MFRGNCLAGAEGIEPTSKVLETFVLPLNDAPMVAIEIIQDERKNGSVKIFKGIILLNEFRRNNIHRRGDFLSV